MAVRETSREAYNQLQHAGTQKDRILAELAKGPASHHALEKRTGISRTSICGRMGELLEAGKVRPAYDDKDLETGMTVTVWELVE